MSQSLAHIALIVRDYDEAIACFTSLLGFTNRMPARHTTRAKPASLHFPLSYIPRDALHTGG